ncbi:MAG: hypothetical protein LBR42_00035 [Candidatus Methanoplasma sp.]|jgi:hypothetical protein|nr:hypothetical protein [Candidatus Methanoplasma sp.]
MAKKKRRIIEEKEEEYEFTPSEFDEREFILKDIYGTKVLFVVTALAIVIGIVGSLLCRASSDMGWIIATVVALFMVLVMKRLLMLMRFRVDLLDMKTMLANYLIFLMLALGVCIVFVNAPFV